MLGMHVQCPLLTEMLFIVRTHDKAAVVTKMLVKSICYSLTTSRCMDNNYADYANCCYL